MFIRMYAVIYANTYRQVLMFHLSQEANHNRRNDYAFLPVLQTENKFNYISGTAGLSDEPLKKYHHCESAAQDQELKH